MSRNVVYAIVKAGGRQEKVEVGTIVVLDRQKAKLGDKTILDVLDPVAGALEAAAASGQSLAPALKAAADAAEAALEATKNMVAQHGKAAAFQQKTVGLQDAGATVGVLLVTTMNEFVAG